MDKNFFDRIQTHQSYLSFKRQCLPVYSSDQCVSQALNVEIGDDEIPDGSELQIRVCHVIE